MSMSITVQLPVDCLTDAFRHASAATTSSMHVFVSYSVFLTVSNVRCHLAVLMKRVAKLEEENSILKASFKSKCFDALNVAFDLFPSRQWLFHGSQLDCGWQRRC
jgi:hypothetical protein